jgi:HemY protein
MFLYVLLLLAIIIAMFWLASFILQHAETVTIIWGTWGSYTVESTNLLIALVIVFIAFYFFIWLFKTLFGIKKNIRNYCNTRLTNKAGQSLTQGLIQFTAGHWTESETLLLRNIDHAETPLLNYLVAARAAHMQENYDNRDQYLKKAAKKGENAHIAVAVSQAEMQLDSKQVEQARATLVHLLELSPAHPYANKLLASVYYKQEDWKNLFDLLPELKKQKLLRKTLQKKYENASLKGIFQSTALKNQPTKLHLLWKKLPIGIKSKPQAVLHYIDALISVDDAKLAEKILLGALNKNWDSALVERFGQIDHISLNKSIQQAEKWLQQHNNSPELLICLARLYRSNMLWGKACYFYESGLNMSPNVKCYLEFAELLIQLDDNDNAALCYQKGLKYCATKKGEALYLKSKNLADPSKAEKIENDKAEKIENDVEIFYTV